MRAVCRATHNGRWPDRQQPSSFPQLTADPNRHCRMPRPAVPYSHIRVADLRVKIPGPMKSVRQHREEIVRVGRMIHERGYVAATDGNLSVRLSENRILVTPTAMSKGMMK